MINKGELSGKLAKEILPKMFETGDAPSVIMEREGLKQISDTGALEKIADEVIAANPKQVEQYKGGKTALLGYLVGQMMKASRGQANPTVVTEILKKKLGLAVNSAPKAALFVMVTHINALHQEQHVFRNVRGVVGNALQVAHN